MRASAKPDHARQYLQGAYGSALSAQARADGASVVPALPRTLRAVSGRAGLLRVRQAAELLGMSTAAVYRLCEFGELPHVRISNAIRVDPEDLASFIARRRAAEQH
jgi:excisionase family DNA binding protein